VNKIEQLNIVGKRSGSGVVAHKATLVNALSRALSERVMLLDFTVGRRGLLGYLKALSGSNIVKIVPDSGGASEVRASAKRLKVTCGNNTSYLEDSAWISDKTPMTFCEVRISPNRTVKPNIGGLELAEALNRVLPFTAKEDNRPVLQCVLFRAKEQEITIFAQVHTIAETNYGTIDEVINYQLIGKMGETIEWAVVEGGEEELTCVKTGTITKEITEPNLVVQQLRKSSLIGLAVSFPIFCALAVLYWMRRAKLSFLEKELNRNRKKYGELISEVSDFPSTRDGEIIIRAASLEALVNISNNSLKPILLKVEPDKHTYYVIDGLVRYEYVSKLELPANEERTEDDRFQT